MYFGTGSKLFASKSPFVGMDKVTLFKQSFHDRFAMTVCGADSKEDLKGSKSCFNENRMADHHEPRVNLCNR